MKPDDRIRLTHMTEALGHAIRFIDEGRSRGDLDSEQAIIGMRRRLVHAYADIGHDILWTTAAEAAPKLLAAVNSTLESG
jgi:uncharacterized protein with HEPN domain